MPAEKTDTPVPASQPLAMIIIGAGFGGIGLGVALRKAGIKELLILEKAGNLGGVWRDNSYPGAACDVPSHLYSFSFEPNPRWTRKFAAQAEILAYLRHCVQKYGLTDSIRLGAEVTEARFDEAQAIWTVQLGDGAILRSRMLVSATGQLSRPSIPKLEGLAEFRGPSFHSARWDHGCALAGKRVAVLGTGASAAQFVPAIATQVSALKVFQRSPAYFLPRPDRAYSATEKALFSRLPSMAKLHRAAIYLQYESRALAFTRFKGLMAIAVGLPFRQMLRRQVADEQLRRKLTPDYPIGCKRILLSSDYLATMALPHVELLTERIERITATGIRTADGQEHEVDAIIFGTGFKASEFLAPMRVIGRNGLSLNEAWRHGAEAFLGLSVPGFPNFFMLYGPNTNLGHNSIIHMLESQIAHVMLCLQQAARVGATAVEVRPSRFTRYNARIQSRLRQTVWNGCSSWYLDASGHNGNNWPGFTWTYRWLTSHGIGSAYDMCSSSQTEVGTVEIATKPGWVETLSRLQVKLLLRGCFKPLIGKPFGPAFQRCVVFLLATLMPGVGGVSRKNLRCGNCQVELLEPTKELSAEGAILYLHGGAFCLGNRRTHRSISTRLAINSGLPVWVPDYRLAPEHPYPAALDDALAAYRELQHRHGPVVVAGDSAGGSLALALASALKLSGEAPPVGLMLLSPLTDPTLSGASMHRLKSRDPMIRLGWLEQGVDWYGCPPSAAEHHPLQADLGGLPPLLIQVGSEEILLCDSLRLAQRARACGVPCRLEIQRGGWHVFQLQAFWLATSRAAIDRLGRFARERVQAPAPYSRPASTVSGISSPRSGRAQRDSQSMKSAWGIGRPMK